MQLAFVPPAASPIRRQYLSIKQQHPDAILFFQLGDFYETFEQDAKTVSQVCDIALTTREMGKGERVPMAGVPVHAADVYVGRLVERGHHIAIAEQVEPSSAKTGGAPALVRREVTRVITPGTLLDPTLLTATKSNFLAAVVIAGSHIGIAHADISTGAFACVDVDGRDNQEVARSELARLQPAECLAVDEEAARALLPGSTPVTVDAGLFAASSAERALCAHFGVATVEALGLAPGSAAVTAAAAVLRYVERTQARAASSLERLELYDPRGYMVIDPATREHLEIVRGATGQRTGSLLHALDKTRTAMGARLLAQWLGHPLLDRARIEARLDAVSALVDLRSLRIEAQEALADMPDMERLAGRAAQRLLSPRAALSLADTLDIAARLRAVLSLMPGVESRLSSVAERIDPPVSVAEDIRSTIVEDPPAAFGEGVIRPKQIAELDEVGSPGTELEFAL